MWLALGVGLVVGFVAGAFYVGCLALMFITRAWAKEPEV